MRTGSVVSIGERTCFISATAQEWCGSLRFRYAIRGPVSQIVIMTARTCAGRWLQAFDRRPSLPARSAVISWTDRLPRGAAATSLSRIRAATLRPVARASCLNRRSIVSGSFTVIPFIITHQGDPILTEGQYRTYRRGKGNLGGNPSGRNVEPARV